ncbi:MAG: HAD-IIIC family phosphatase [Candidatus Omnitrophica bacterium]|nr:HAD-IIIC family phosphatase [Candidatus Omnitrophota bacterium]
MRVKHLWLYGVFIAAVCAFALSFLFHDLVLDVFIRIIGWLIAAMKAKATIACAAGLGFGCLLVGGVSDSKPNGNGPKTPKVSPWGTSPDSSPAARQNTPAAIPSQAPVKSPEDEQREGFFDNISPKQYEWLIANRVISNQPFRTVRSAVTQNNGACTITAEFYEMSFAGRAPPEDMPEACIFYVYENSTLKIYVSSAARRILENIFDRNEELLNIVYAAISWHETSHHENKSHQQAIDAQRRINDYPEVGIRLELLQILVYLGYPLDKIPALIAEFENLLKGMAFTAYFIKILSSPFVSNHEVAQLLSKREESGQQSYTFSDLQKIVAYLRGIPAGIRLVLDMVISQQSQLWESLLDARVDCAILKLLASAFYDRDILPLLNNGEMKEAERRKFTRSIVSCAPTSQLFCVLIKLLGFEVQAANVPKHIFPVIPLGNNRILCVDFPLVIVEDLSGSYESRQEGACWLLKNTRPRKNKFSVPKYPYICLSDERGFSWAIQGNLAITLRNLGMLKEAEMILKKPLRENPEYFENHSIMGAILLDSCRYQEAEAEFRQAIALSPEVIPEFYFRLATALDGQKRFHEAAAQSFERFIVLKPKDKKLLAEAHYRLGMIFSKLQRHEEAIDAFLNAVRIEPKDAYYRRDLADAYLNWGRALFTQKGDIAAVVRNLAMAAVINPEISENDIPPGICRLVNQAMFNVRAELLETLPGIFAPPVVRDGRNKAPGGIMSLTAAMPFPPQRGNTGPFGGAWPIMCWLYRWVAGKCGYTAGWIILPVLIESLFFIVLGDWGISCYFGLAYNFGVEHFSRVVVLLCLWYAMHIPGYSLTGLKEEDKDLYYYSLELLVAYTVAALAVLVIVAVSGNLYSNRLFPCAIAFPHLLWGIILPYFLEGERDDGYFTLHVPSATISLSVVGLFIAVLFLWPEIMFVSSVIIAKLQAFFLGALFFGLVGGVGDVSPLGASQNNTQDIHEKSTAVPLRKCLVLDCDNTLWSGVVAEDEVEGISLPAEYLEFQRTVKGLQRRGVILAINSKNDLADIEQVFSKRADMVLQRSDFAVVKANWQDKAANLRAIAQELNIGLDSLVFIDDSPQERAWVRDNCPEVLVLPEDNSAHPADWIKFLSTAFPQQEVTEEARRRTALYAQHTQREDAKAAFGSLDDFKRSLAIRLTIREGNENSAHVIRIAELTQRTNQFNLTGKKYTKDKIKKFLGSSEYRIFSLEYRDRFGNAGVVGVMIMHLCTGSRLVIDAFCLSCRVLIASPYVERGFMASVIDALKKENWAGVRGYFVPTGKNELVRNLYPQVFGFEAEQETMAYSLDLLRQDRTMFSWENAYRNAYTVSPVNLARFGLVCVLGNITTGLTQRITAMRFMQKPASLLCGTDDGHVINWEVGDPFQPGYLGSAKGGLIGSKSEAAPITDILPMCSSNNDRVGIVFGNRWFERWHIDRSFDYSNSRCSAAFRDDKYPTTIVCSTVMFDDHLWACVDNSRRLSGLPNNTVQFWYVESFRPPELKYSLTTQEQGDVVFLKPLSSREILVMALQRIQEQPFAYVMEFWNMHPYEYTQNPLPPQFMASFPLGEVISLDISENDTLMAAVTASSVAIYDIRNPARVTLVSTIPLERPLENSSVAFSGDNKLLAFGEREIWDISNPSEPKFVTQFKNPDGNKTHERM